MHRLTLLFPSTLLALGLACSGGSTEPAGEGASEADGEPTPVQAEGRPRHPKIPEGKKQIAPPPDLDERPPPHDGPNVLVIVWDTVRADRLSAYGYERETTPYLDALGKEGVVYERAVSPGMWTLPSHASMFTGLPVSAHGANADHKWLDHRFTTMAEWFRDHGYGTYLFAANPYLQDHTNLGQGFDAREFPWDDKWKKAAKKATMGKIIERDASNSLGPAWKKTVYPTGRTNDKVKDAGPVASEALFSWLGERATQEHPFFAVLNYMEAHVPRIPSMEARKALFSDEEIEAQLTLDQAFPFLLAYTTGFHEFSDEELSVISDTYDASLRDLDAATGVLFDRLEAEGLLDDTIVVVTADHGEHLGEHHRIGHKYSVYNPLVRVPLVIRYPEGLEPARVEKVVSNLHIFGTLTELAGLPMPEGTESSSLLALGELPDAAFSELVAPTPQALKRMQKVHGKFDWSPFLYTYASVEAPEHKCIQRSDGQRELYAMATDPLESKDLSGEQADTAEALCGSIGPWRSTFAAYDPDARGEGDDPSKANLSDEDRERLKMLGYLEEDEADGEGE